MTLIVSSPKGHDQRVRDGLTSSESPKRAVGCSNCRLWGDVVVL
ncbi:hypothetical protein ACFFX1_14810 [Dactylosporangium sucinum]|nr:hypothetical protein [Dactylosporangium sucinum]